MLKKVLITAGISLLSTAVVNAADASKPTVVLVHGAFADSSSWNGVTKILLKDGYQVVAAANPLRGVRADADYVAEVVKSIEAPVVLVGHSYGGSVISDAANGLRNVKSLVFVAAFAPDAGESAADLSGKFPGGTLATALAKPVALPGGGSDLYIEQGSFHQQFAHDVAVEEASLMAATQRPIAEAALGEKSGQPSWKTISSWSVYGDGDRNIPAAALKFMAERAKSKGTIVVKGASHVVMVSHAVAKVIEQASE